MTGQNFVLFEQREAIVTLTLNAPEARNALSSQAQWDAVVAACERRNNARNRASSTGSARNLARLVSLSASVIWTSIEAVKLSSNRRLPLLISVIMVTVNKRYASPLT